MVVLKNCTKTPGASHCADMNQRLADQCQCTKIYIYTAFFAAGKSELHKGKIEEIITVGAASM
jgi:hypothetical protein